jgi:hypothetical protein
VHLDAHKKEKFVSSNDQRMTSHKFKTYVYQNWGIIICVVSCLIALIRILNPAELAHYRLFSRAAVALWQQQDPYYTTFDAGTGWWMYSPSCGLFYYGLFAFLPFRLGLYLSTLSSLGIFTYAIKRTINAFTSIWPFETRLQKNWLWFWLSFHLMAGILASKIEILTVGLSLLALTLLVKRKNQFLVAFLLGMLVNWKFQTLPLVGLWCLILLFIDRNWRFSLAVIASLAFWFFVPALVVGSQLHQLNINWFASVNEWMQTEWVRLSSLFHLLLYFSIPVTLKMLTTTGAVIGLGLCALIINWIIKANQILPRELVRSLALILGLVCSSWFAVALSPMSENNGYVLVAPLWLFAFIFYPNIKGKRGFWWIVSVSGFTGSILLSDTFGKHSRLFFNDLGIKPYGFTILFVGLLYWFHTSLLSQTPTGSKQRSQLGAQIPNPEA